jgi:hypothetical protein
VEEEEDKRNGDLLVRPQPKRPAPKPKSKQLSKGQRTFEQLAGYKDWQKHGQIPWNANAKSLPTASSVPRSTTPSTPTLTATRDVHMSPLANNIFANGTWRDTRINSRTANKHAKPYVAQMSKALMTSAEMMMQAGLNKPKVDRLGSIAVMSSSDDLSDGNTQAGGTSSDDSGNTMAGSSGSEDADASYDRQVDAMRREEDAVRSRSRKQTSRISEGIDHYSRARRNQAPPEYSGFSNAEQGLDSQHHQQTDEVNLSA